VEAAEGDLERVTAADILSRHPGFECRSAAGGPELQRRVEEALAGRDLSMALLWAALCVFMAEGLLAWRWSRTPAGGGGGEGASR
jgi:hypothetical protein